MMRESRNNKVLHTVSLCTTINTPLHSMLWHQNCSTGRGACSCPLLQCLPHTGHLHTDWALYRNMRQHKGFSKTHDTQIDCNTATSRSQHAKHTDCTGMQQHTDDGTHNTQLVQQQISTRKVLRGPTKVRQGPMFTGTLILGIGWYGTQGLYGQLIIKLEQHYNATWRGRDNM
jgi:hypothetical protein